MVETVRHSTQILKDYMESGSFSRAVRLPAEVEGDKAEATYVAGVLTISLPLKEAAKPKEIPVRVVEG